MILVAQVMSGNTQYFQHQVFFCRGTDLSHWHQRSIMGEDEGDAGDNQTTTQEIVSQQGSMILLSDKWGIQLGDTVWGRRKGQEN